MLEEEPSVISLLHEDKNAKSLTSSRNAHRRRRRYSLVSFQQSEPEDIEVLIIVIIISII